MTTGETIRFLRKEKGLTQKELSEKTGIATITIQGYEADKYKPRQDKIEKLAAAFDVPTLCFEDYSESIALQRLHLTKLSVGKRVQVLRIWKCYTLEDLAIRMNEYWEEPLSKSIEFVEGIEEENGSISYNVALNLSKIFNVPIEMFNFTDTDSADRFADLDEKSIPRYTNKIMSDFSINTTLNANEQLVIDTYRKLNALGKSRIKELATDFSNLEKYTTPDPDLDEE